MATTAPSITAPIKWAQRADSLYLTIALSGTFDVMCDNVVNNTTISIPNFYIFLPFISLFK